MRRVRVRVRVRGGRSVRSLHKSGSGSESGSIPLLVGALPSWTAQTSLPSCDITATIRLRYPVSQVRIPSRVLSIPRPIATPTPILLHHRPFRIPSSNLLQRNVWMDHNIGPTHFHGQIENATAPSAGGSPDGNGEIRLGKRLPFRAGSGSGWGGLPQRSQRAQRCIGRGGKGLASEPFSTTALVN